MEVRKITRTPQEQAEEEYTKATVEKQKKTIEKQTALIGYLAEMLDIYIPEEEEDTNNVQHFVENEDVI